MIGRCQRDALGWEGLVRGASGILGFIRESRG